MSGIAVLLNNLNVPGFVAHAEGIVLGIANIEISQIGKSLEFIGFGKFHAEVFVTEALFTNVKIAERVIRMTRRCQRIRCE